MHPDEVSFSPTPNPVARVSVRVVLVHVLFLLALGLILFFVGLGDRDLWASHEGRAAQDAQSLLDDGFGDLPHLFDGRTELQKPPLYYWLVAWTAQATGRAVDPWAVRFPAAVSGMLGILALYVFCARVGRPIAGLVAAATLATAFHYAWLARTGRIDMPLTLTTSLALFGGAARPPLVVLSSAPGRRLLACQSPSPRWYVALCALTRLADRP